MISMPVTCSSSALPRLTSTRKWCSPILGQAVIDSSGAITEAGRVPGGHGRPAGSRSVPEHAVRRLGRRRRRRDADGRAAPDAVCTLAIISRTGPITAEIALHGPFYMVPDWLYFRREHPGQGGKLGNVRNAVRHLDPRRASRLTASRSPGSTREYIWGYVTAIRHAPLSPADRRSATGAGALGRAAGPLPVASRTLSRSGLQAGGATRRSAARHVDRCGRGWPSRRTS